ncbi:MAG: 4'-phosphopantetheinyl transferase superfamily protein [Ruminococcus sp.]|nr:4'-phosphopantetheinyl transferase superfamily protein [Ruminococcus sp.]
MIYRVENISNNNFTSLLYTEAYECMSKDRRKKADRLLNEEDKRLCVFSDWLLREMLTAEGISNPELYTDEKGKPFIKGNPLYFNISHSGTFIACAIDTKPLGIDIEVYREISAALTKHICTDDETKFIFKTSDNINDTDTLKRFFSVWTAKEAYLKCTGEGLSGGLKNISVAAKDGIKERLSPNHKLLHTATDDYALSIVTSI